jgi:serine/threonine protein kinase
MSSYDKLTYKVLPKNSASPTIIVLNKTKNQIYKCWNSATDTKYTKGLEYEKFVYEKVIKQLLSEDQNLPFLRYIGEAKFSIKDFAKYLDLDKSSADTLKLSIMMFLNDEDNINTFSSNELYNYAGSKSKYLTDKDMQDAVVLKMIVLPNIEFRTIKDILTVASTEKVVHIIRKIVEGLSALYKKGVVHNDLHHGNIMIENKTEKVLIFDWDRSYMKGYNNPLISDQQCKGTCKRGQCNIFNPDGYSIDFFKILCYIIKSRSVIGDADKILSSISNIRDGLTSNIVIDFMKSNKYCHYKDNLDCNYLQFPDTKMEFVKKQFGSIFEIEERIISRFGKNDKINLNSELSNKFGFETKNEKKYNKEFKRMFELGRGDEYLEDNKAYLEKHFPVKNIVVHQSDKDPKSRSLANFL